MKWLNDKFVAIADRVSYLMGTPGNIIFWIIAVATWIICGPLIAKSNFLPDWFTSNAFNFPLNTVTTLAELYIGFLVAAAANRSEKHLHEIIEDTDSTVKTIREVEENEDELLRVLQSDIQVVHKHLEEIKVKLGIPYTDDQFSVVEK